MLFSYLGFIEASSEYSMNYPTPPFYLCSHFRRALPDEIIFVVAAVVVVGSMMCRRLGTWSDDGHLVSKVDKVEMHLPSREAFVLCDATSSHFFVILLSDFMPGSNIHKINHSHTTAWLVLLLLLLSTRGRLSGCGSFFCSLFACLSMG